MRETFGDGYFKSAVLLMLAVAVGGCSKPGGFYVVPEHQDLGVIDAQVAIAEFEIVNGSDRPVKVQHIYPSCNCTTVELQDNPIPPGKSTILRATANLSQRAGKQEFSVFFSTDSSEFPAKRVSFAALVPATGTRQRSITIGSFYPDAEFDIELPARSFTRGSVELMEESKDNHSSNIATHLADSRGGESALVVEGTAPRAVGAFSKTLQFRETIPGEPSLGEGIVELELLGYVVARWIVKPDLYVGFVSLSKDGGIVSLSIERSPAVSSVEQRKTVACVTATISEKWLSLQSQSTNSDGIELNFMIHEDKLEQLGAAKAVIKLTIEYIDGEVESYSTNLFAHIDH